VPSHTLLLLRSTSRRMRVHPSEHMAKEKERKQRKKACTSRRNVSFKLDSESSVRGLGVSSSYSSGCLISETQEPQWRCLTPRNFFFDCSTMLPDPPRLRRAGRQALQILCQGKGRKEGQRRQAAVSVSASGSGVCMCSGRCPAPPRPASLPFR
jgi:hypothetical protein